MFSTHEKKEIAKKVEEVLLSFKHPEMPGEKPIFTLHVEGAESWSWADIEPNWKFAITESNIKTYEEFVGTFLEHEQRRKLLGNKIFRTVWSDIMEERERQDEKFGRQEHYAPMWFLILAEEVGEVAKALLHTIFGGPERGKAREELVQVAAVAVNWLEAITDKRAILKDRDGDVVEW